MNIVNWEALEVGARVTDEAGGIHGIVSPLATSRKLRRSFRRKFRSSEKGGMIRKEGLVGGCDRT